MAQGEDLNPLNAPSAGEFIGVEPDNRQKGDAAQKLYGKGKRLQLPPKTRYDMLRTQLNQERESWRPHVRDLKQNFQPHRTRYIDDSGNPNLGSKKMQYIVDNTPLLAVRTLAAGLMSSVTNPSRPWIRMKPKDDDDQDIDF